MSNSKIAKHEHKVLRSAAEHHRKAAHHFEATAKHQILAAQAADHDDVDYGAVGHSHHD